MKKHAPEIAEALLAEARQNMAHDRRIAWVNVISGVLIGLAGVIVPGLVAWHLADAGMPLYGVGVMGAGAVSTTAGSVLAARSQRGGRVARQRAERPTDSESA
jgi:hypothetical protein